MLCKLTVAFDLVVSVFTNTSIAVSVAVAVAVAVTVTVTVTVAASAALALSDFRSTVAALLHRLASASTSLQSTHHE
jgi:hypothetical protein